jgi:ABC-2 type transport system permease protein
MFRLLWQELSFRRNAIIGWGLGLCFFPIVYLGIYPQVAEEMQGLADLEIYQAMGVSLGSLEDWIGSVIILFVPLLTGIFAVINGTGTLAGEEEDGRLEMIVTLPLPRWQIVTAKAIALNISTFIILVIVSLAAGAVFLAIESQLETDIMATDVGFVPGSVLLKAQNRCAYWCGRHHRQLFRQQPGKYGLFLRINPASIPVQLPGLHRKCCH